MTQTPRVLIAGAGIGGLTAALALLRAGTDVEIFEQASALEQLGAGIQISANGARVLFHLGLQHSLQAVWSEPAGKEVRLWSTGQTWKLFDLGAQSRQRYGAPYFMVHRADLHRVLIEALQMSGAGKLRLNAKCAGFEQDRHGVNLVLETGERIGGDALIGADGVHSRIRAELFGPDQPYFTGCMAWRGLIATERLPRHLRTPVGTNWIGPGGHVVHYPVRRGELLNFVGIVEREDWQVESWTEQGSVEECAGDYRGWNRDVHLLIENIQTPFKWALLGRDPLPRWTVDRVSLLGDAAHPTLPFMAQGANMAIEDAGVLARCIGCDRDNIPRALMRYDAARRERTSRLVLAAAENTRRFHNPALAEPSAAQHYVDTEWQEEKIKQRYDWVFEYDALQVPV